MAIPSELNPRTRRTGDRPRHAARVPVIAAAVWLAALGFLPAQEGTDPTAGRGQVRGEVTTVDDDPVIGISIVLSPITRPDILYATSTDSKGRYSFDGLVPDRYRIRADGQGFETMIKNGVHVRPPFRAITDFEMEIDPEAGTGDGPAADGEDSTGRIGSIVGMFRNAEGEAVLEGSIALRRVGHPEDVFYARTDPDGRFELGEIPAGRYNIRTRSPGLIPLHLVGRELPAVQTLYLRLVAPDYPLAFKGWLDDLLPEEIPIPPPAPRAVDLGAFPQTGEASGDPAVDEPPETTGEAPADGEEEPGTAGSVEEEDG